MGALTLERNQVTVKQKPFLRQQVNTFDLESACQQLKLMPDDITGAMRRSNRQYPFPLLVQGMPLFVDEALKFPINLNSVLQTAALYQKLNWEETLDRQIAIGEFFRHYVKGLVEHSLPLFVINHFALDLSAANLVATVAQGVPTGIQLRSLQPVSIENFGLILLEHNLKPLVIQLSEISGEKAEIFWDYAIETIFDLLVNLPVDSKTKQKTRHSILIGELDSFDQLISLTTCEQNDDIFDRSGIIYLKKKCCKSYRKGSRCKSCPAFAKKGSLRE